MTSLHVKSFEDYETIIPAGRNFDAVYFIDESQVNIIDSTGMFVLAVLDSGSFFGEFQVLHNLASGFEYRIDRVKTLDKTKNRSTAYQNQKKTENWLYFIRADRFRQICNDFPEQLDFMRVRSSLRRAHLIKI